MSWIIIARKKPIPTFHSVLLPKRLTAFRSNIVVMTTHSNLLFKDRQHHVETHMRDSRFSLIYLFLSWIINNMWHILWLNSPLKHVKPIFHCKLGLRWVINANEMSTNNMKCTWPTRQFCIWGPNTTYIPLACVGVLPQCEWFCVGVEYRLTGRINVDITHKIIII